MAVLACSPAYALKASTLCRGSKGENVRLLQQALINLGYLSGKADGKFGPMTEQAVIQFQQANNLTADGLAGTKTLTLLLGSANPSAAQSTSVQASVQAPAATSSSSSASSSTSSSSVSSAPAASSTSSGGLFGGDYTTISIGDRGARVRILQQALISLKYLSGKADGIFGNQTLNAVYKFQSRSGLKQDGLAGKKTLTALEAAVSSGTVAPAAETSQASSSSQAAAPAQASASSSSSASTVAKVSAPDSSSIKLLHWFNDIKPSLKNGDYLLIYDPSSGLSWTLKVISRGRHCDCEPLTKADTDTMVQSFGGKNTWTQHGVYVKLPSGVWTVGSTHDMPHQSGSIKDNGFDGHLCVHFLRNMEEAETNDPNYGVSNQKTIRELWKRISGQDINY